MARPARSGSLRSSFAGALALVALVALIASPRAAHAQLALGAGADVGYVASAPQHLLGAGFSGLIGYRLALSPLPVLWLMPEIAGSYLTFQAPAGESFHPARVVAGLRFGVGSVVQPQIHAHVGYAWTGAASVPGSAEIARTRGYTADAGASLDLRLVPLLSVGVHLSYVLDQLSAPTTDLTRALQEGTQWIDAGVHARLVF